MNYTRCGFAPARSLIRHTRRAPSMTDNVLITGSSGLIGGILTKELAGSFTVYGMDLRAQPGSQNGFQADIRQPEQIESVFERISPLRYVVHLAGDPRVEADWESA